MAKVNAFRESLPPKGVLYNRYGNLNEFVAAFRLHLARVIQEWGTKWGGRNCAGDGAETSERAEEEPEKRTTDEDVGFLDLVEAGNEHMDVANRRATEIATAIVRLGVKFSSPQADVRETIDRGDTVTLKKVLSELAGDLVDFGGSIDESAPQLSQSYATAINAYGRAAIIAHKINPADTTSLLVALETVRALDASLKEARPQIASFAEVLDEMPAVTTVFVRAKRVAKEAVTSLLREWDKASTLSGDLDAVLSSLVDESRRSTENDRPAAT